MVDTTTLFMGIIFFLVVLIIIVYFVYYNRIVTATAVITDFGVSLTPQSNTSLLLTTESQRIGESATFLRNVLIVTNSAGGQRLAAGTQGWVFFDAAFNEVSAFSADHVKNSDNGQVTLNNGEITIFRNSFTGGYVTYTDDGQVFADTESATTNDPNMDSAIKNGSFTAEFTDNFTIMALKANRIPLVNGQASYLIPNASGQVIIGIPTSDALKNWIVD